MFSFEMNTYKYIAGIFLSVWVLFLAMYKIYTYIELSTVSYCRKFPYLKNGIYYTSCGEKGLIFMGIWTFYDDS